MSKHVHSEDVISRLVLSRDFMGGEFYTVTGIIYLFICMAENWREKSSERSVCCLNQIDCQNLEKE